MEIFIQHSNERGLTELGWLHSRHSFSFGNYHNPKRMRFGLLRVLNDDIVEPGKGFGTHFHDNMEIVSIVLEGSLEHKDSMGNQGVIKEGEVQRVSAGTGIFHSEFNHSSTEKVHFLQIWIEPKEINIKPGYEQKNFIRRLAKNRLIEIVSGEKGKETIYMNQYACSSIGKFDNNKTITYEVKDIKNGVFVFVIDGQIDIGKNILNKGGSAEITGISITKLKTKKESQVLVIEVPLK